MNKTLQVITGDHYLAFMLDNQSRNEILRFYGNRFSNLKCEHITIAYDFCEKNVVVLQEFINTKPEFSITEHLVADGIELLKVTTNNGALRPLDGTFHLTLSHREDRKPSDSNKILNGKIKTLESFSVKFSPPISLFGEFLLIPKKKPSQVIGTN